MASITPDPKKRSYLLPPGCKDLIDVLQPRGQRAGQHIIGPDPDPATLRTGEGKGGLTEIGRYVAMVFESRAETFNLTIAPLDERFSINVDRTELLGTWAHVSVPQSTEQETAVRGYFERHGLPVPENTTVPAQFFPNLPVYLSYDLLPVPHDAAQITRLVASLLSEVCEVTDDSGLIFRYHEMIPLSLPGSPPPG